MKKYLLAYPFLSKVLSLSFTTLVAHLITLCYYPFLTKTYTAEDFGNFQTFQSISAYFITVCCFRFDQAIITSNDKAERGSLLRLSVITAFIFSAGLAVVMLLVKDQISAFANYRIIAEYWYLLPLNTFVGGCLNAVLSALVITQRFNKIGVGKIAQSSFTVMSQAAAAGLMRSIGLVVGELIGKVFFLVTTFRNSVRFAAGAGSNSFRQLRQTAKKFREFIWISTPGALLNMAGFNLPMLIIAGFYSQTVFGYIALVDRLFGIPSALIGQSVSQVFTAEFSLAVADGPDKARKLFLNQIRILSVIILPVIALLPFAPYLFSTVFGEEWATSGSYFIILAPMNVAGFIISPIIPALTVLNRQKTLFAWVLVRVIFTVSAIFILSRNLVPVTTALYTYSWLMTFFYIVYGVIAYKAIGGERSTK